MSTGSTQPNLSAFPSLWDPPLQQPQLSSSVPSGVARPWKWMGGAGRCGSVDLWVCSIGSSSAMSSNQGNLVVPELNPAQADRHCNSSN